MLIIMKTHATQCKSVAHDDLNSKHKQKAYFNKTNQVLDTQRILVSMIN